MSRSRTGPQRIVTWLRASLEGRTLPLVPLVVVAATAITTVSGALPSEAVADPTYTVMNAPEGVYWRSEPNWNAAERISGFGVYNGTTIEVHCYQSGTAVEGSADTMWEQATDVAGSGYGSGWLNEHFINDGSPINQPSPGVPPCGGPPPEERPPEPVEEHPSGGGLVFPIFNAEGGIYYRNSPHWADTPQTPGVGVYNGDQVQLICGAFGDPVGPFSDTAWSYVNNLSRSVGEGWVNEHFINDGALSNQFVAGEPMCGAEIPGVSGGGSGSGGSGSGGSSGSGGATGSTPDPPPSRSLYFSPYWANPHGTGTTGDVKGDGSNRFHTNWVHAPAPTTTITMNGGDWDKNQDKNGCPALASFVPKGQAAFDNGQITTLASWSLARSAPFLFLKARPDWISKIHYILLFDPGTQHEWDDSPCDNEYSMARILRAWLIADSSNKLAILSGVSTADVGHRSIDGHGHAGIQDQLFVPLKILGEPSGRHLRSQIVVCNYDTMSHPDVWINFNSWINDPPITLSTCPIDPRTKKLPTSWNP
jgi:uncharacterized membrane protein YgcG